MSDPHVPGDSSREPDPHPVAGPPDPPRSEIELGRRTQRTITGCLAAAFILSTLCVLLVWLVWGTAFFNWLF